MGYSKLQLENGFRNGLSNKLESETEHALSPWYMHYTFLQWEYLHSSILATVCFDTKKALLLHESHRRLEGKKPDKMGITLYRAGGATF